MLDYTSQIKSCLISKDTLTTFINTQYKGMDMIQQGDMFDLLRDLFVTDGMKEFVLSNSAAIGECLGVKITSDGANEAFINSVKNNLTKKFGEAVSL